MATALQLAILHQRHQQLRLHQHALLTSRLCPAPLHPTTFSSTDNPEPMDSPVPELSEAPAVTSASPAAPICTVQQQQQSLETLFALDRLCRSQQQLAAALLTSAQTSQFAQLLQQTAALAQQQQKPDICESQLVATHAVHQHAAVLKQPCAIDPAPPLSGVGSDSDADADPTAAAGDSSAHSAALLTPAQAQLQLWEQQQRAVLLALLQQQQQHNIHRLLANLSLLPAFAAASAAADSCAAKAASAAAATAVATAAPRHAGPASATVESCWSIPSSPLASTPTCSPLAPARAVVDFDDASFEYSEFRPGEKQHPHRLQRHQQLQEQPPPQQPMPVDFSPKAVYDFGCALSWTGLEASFTQLGGAGERGSDSASESWDSDGELEQERERAGAAEVQEVAAGGETGEHGATGLPSEEDFEMHLVGVVAASL